MVILNLDKKSKVPLFKQVVSQLIKKIENDTLSAGEKLPSTRKFAEKLGVNRATIYKAYQELWALGYIESRSGSYSYVRDRRICRTQECCEKKSSIDWEKTINPNAENVYQYHKKVFYPFSKSNFELSNEIIDFTQLHPDSRLYPLKDFKRAFNLAISKLETNFLDYGENEGYLPLRKFISTRMRLHGILTNTDEILITNGAQNAIDLLLKLLIQPGSRVFIESPTYSMILSALRFYNCDVIPIPMTETGADINAIKEEIKKGAPAFFYTMTNCQNPTGVTTSQEHREQLLEIFEKANVPIIEDAFEEEMKYFGKITMPIKSMDVNNQVIYIGSFSKILFPGIRLGWISAPKECIERLTTLKRTSDLNSPMPIQAVIEQFCNNGFYDIHIKKINKIYKKRMQLTLDLLKGIKNPKVKWHIPSGGYTVWITLEKLELSYEELNDLFFNFKIKLSLGRDFFAFPVQKRHFRLSIARLNEDEITTGIRRFIKAVNHLYSSKRRNNGKSKSSKISDK